ncbi:hypothetical protein AWB71_05342 [Caballeronia peredens]|nr:hypothetical protein AWB71_05342 [Caballeronia peredens]
MLFCLEREYGVTCVLGRKREYENRTRATHIWVNVPYPVQVQKVEGLMKKYDTTFAGLCKLAIHETRAKLHTIEEDELTHKYFK